MESQSYNNKRIFKNTIILYVRMVIVLLITLYTSRVVLKALGVDDFGLYNVVGGVVALLSFFNVTMARSTQRFLNVAMVEGGNMLSKIFASSITVHLMFVIIFLVLGETVGLWFLNAKINIPEGRELAANIVYQASIVSFCISIISIPYNAAVIAYERMGFLALIGIIDAVVKLGIAFLVLNSSNDRLILYGVLLLCVTLLNLLMYIIYCRIKYPILKFRISLDKNDFKQIFSFVSWTLVGEAAQVGCNHGNVILVNLFHSLSANAAMTVGGQINNALYGLTSNFQTAFIPQITKSYTEGNFGYLRALVYSSSKLSYWILFVVALPVSFNIDWILSVWLEEVPPMSNIFAILFLINALLNALCTPFQYVVLSNKNIRNFQLISSFVYLIDLPLAYLLFTLGLPAPTVILVKIGTMVVITFIRFLYASKIVPDIKIVEYILHILVPIIAISALFAIIAIVFNNNLYGVSTRLLYTLIMEIICVISVLIFGLEKRERELLKSYVRFNRTK